MSADSIVASLRELSQQAVLLRDQFFRAGRDSLPEGHPLLTLWAGSDPSGQGGGSIVATKIPQETGPVFTLQWREELNAADVSPASRIAIKFNGCLEGLLTNFNNIVMALEHFSEPGMESYLLEMLEQLNASMGAWLNELENVRQEYAALSLDPARPGAHAVITAAQAEQAWGADRSALAHIRQTVQEHCSQIGGS
jgi:hypothetical protein